MSSRNPSGTFTKPAPQSRTTVVVQKPSERARFCGCCCRMPQQSLLLLLSFGYLAITVLSSVSVCAGVNNYMTHYKGQVELDTTKYTITPVSASTLSISTGWLRYTDGKKAGFQELANLSTGSSILGFVTAFLLLCSAIWSTWRLFSIACCGGRSARKSVVCPALLLSFLTIGFLFAFYAVTSRDLDTYAHKSLGVSSKYAVAMVPDYAWYSGFAAALTWILVAIFAVGLPSETAQEYHKY